MLTTHLVDGSVAAFAQSSNCLLEILKYVNQSRHDWGDTISLLFFGIQY